MADKKLFYALWPDSRQSEILRNTISPIARLVEGHAVFRGNWHVTLVYIGQFPEERVPELMERAAMIRPEPFRLRFDRAYLLAAPPDRLPAGDDRAATAAINGRSDQQGAGGFQC